MIPDLFDGEPRDVALAPGAMLLGGFARPLEALLLNALRHVQDVAPVRHMLTPNGRRMSVAMTNCGAVGLGQRPHRVPVRLTRSGEWRAMAGHA